MANDKDEKDKKDDDELLDKVGAAKVLNVSVDAIGILRRRNDIEYVKFSPRTIRYRRSSLEAHIARSTKQRKK